MAATDTGQSDIIIHLVNPYKCSDCGSEFFLKSALLEHLADHIDKLKNQNLCSQIVCGGVNIVPQLANSITVTRDILQINENQIFELQDSTIDYSQLTPLRILEQAGILSLPPPHNKEPRPPQNEVHVINNHKQPTGQAPQPPPQQELAPSNSVSRKPHGHLLKTDQTSEFCAISKRTAFPETNSQFSQNANSIIQPSYIVDNSLKGDLNMIIETPVQAQGEPVQTGFVGIRNDSFQDVQSWGDADMDAIMSGKHVVLVKKVLKPDCQEPKKNGRAVCKICFNEFSNKTALVRHQVVHTGVKPHCCFTCFKVFNDISSYRKHLLIHKRSHRCPLCHKMFLRRRQMEIHQRQHNKKRFIQFGPKYHEVHVSTSRNEHGQMVHEFSLSVLMNKANTHNAKGESSLAGDDNLPNGNSCTPGSADDLTKEVDSTEQSSDPKEIEANVNKSHEEVTQSHQISEESQTIKSNKKIIYKCGHCKKIIYTRPSLARHLMIHTNEKPFNCEKCGKQFRHKSDLMHHHKTHLKPFKCPSCSSCFSRQSNLNRHLEGGCTLFSDDISKFTVLPDLTYQCNLCSKNLKVKVNIFRHMRVHAFEARKVQESDAKKVAKTVTDSKPCFSKGGDISDPSSQDPENFIRPLTNSVGFQCTICEEEFRFRSFILIHIRMHLNQRPYKCEECGIGFYGRYKLKKHQQCHTRPFKCPSCGKGFNRRYLMTHHFNMHHGKESEDKMKDITVLWDKSLLVCDICGKTMKSHQKSLMQYHIRLHKDVRPHQCDECQKSFISDSALRKHKLNHRKPYVCQVCEKGFSRRYLMLEHFKKTCGLLNLREVSEETQVGSKSASSSLPAQQLQPEAEGISPSDTPYQVEISHERDEEKGKDIYKCVPCDKPFLNKDTLLKHIKTFAKPTPCKYCSLVSPDKHLSISHQRSCLGSEVTSYVNKIKKTNVASHSQKKVLRVMEEMNKTIETYSSAPVTGEKEGSSEAETATSNNVAINSESPSTHTEVLLEKEEHSKKKRKRKGATLSLNNQNSYPCPECDRCFLTTRGLKIHAACHVRLFKCEDCGEDFTQIKAFRRHMKSHKGENDEESEIDEEVDEKPKVATANKEMRESCESDGEEEDVSPSADGNEVMKSESVESIPVKKTKLNNSLAGSSDSKTTEANAQKEPKMDVAARLMQSGTRGRPYSCRKCRRRFTDETGLRSHMLHIHGVASV